MPPYSSYQNLDLEIDAHGEEYRVHVINSPVGQAGWTPFTLPFSPSQLQQARALFGSVRSLRPIANSEPSLDPKVFGVQLYNTVFGGEIGRCLSRSLERVGSETGLRIRLRLNNAPDLADLPWEYLCAPPPFDFFALSTRTPIVRYLATQSAETPLIATLPLRILVVIANPSSPEFPALNVEAEWVKLQEALADLLRRQLVVLERLEAATLDALSKRLHTTLEKSPVHLLHFIGHGATNVLLFEDKVGKPHMVEAKVLGKILREHRWLRLVFLNACEGGRSDEKDIFMGVAPQLVEQEVPAVIAMKYAITDHAAIDLASQFYAAIADGYPVDAALADARRAIYAGAASVEWGTPLLFMRSTDSALIDPLDLATIPPCPYPGMIPFSSKEARFFFGRDEEIAAMRLLLRNQKQLFVIGPSGSGKSSLVFAGLLPELEKKEPGKWTIRTLRPGAKPTLALQEAIGDLVVLPLPALLPTPEQGERIDHGVGDHGVGDHGVGRSLPPSSTGWGDRTLLLVIDQLEELFVQNPKADQNTFIAQLKALSQRDRLKLLFTLRADFYTDLMNSDFWPVDPSQRKEIAPLRGENLRNAIKEPAASVGVTLEGGLVERLLADAADEPGVLPLLQETMVLLWPEQKRRILPLAAYTQLGTQGRSGLAVAMASKADAMLASLSQEEQTIARRIFLRLVQFGEGRSDTRRQQSLNDLRQVTHQADLFNETIRVLDKSRLLTLSGEASDAERKVDIAHEMLIVGWPTSQSWVKARREAELARRRLEEKAKEWVRLGRGNSGLLDEAELAEAQRWMSGSDADDLGYSADLQKLTETSYETIQKEKDEKEAIREREEKKERDLAVQTVRAVTSRRFSYGLAVLLLLAITIAAIAYSQWQNANRQKQIAEKNERVAITAKKVINANLLVAQSVRLVDTDPQRTLLIAAEASKLIGSQDTDAAASASSADTDFRRLLQQVGGTPLPAYEGAFFPKLYSREPTVVFSPTGKWLASANDEKVWLWETVNPNAPRVLRYQSSAVVALAFSPDEQWLASAGYSQTIHLSNLNDLNAKPQILHSDVKAVTSLAFSPTGQWLASAGADAKIRLWPMPNPITFTHVLTGDANAINVIAFSRDGRWLASGGEDGKIRLWGLADLNATPYLLKGHQARIRALTFSGDGQWLASASADATIRLWSLTEPNAEPRVLRGHTAPVWAAAFSPDGRWLASGSRDRTVRLWDLRTPSNEPLVLLPGHSDYVQTLAFSPDGHWLASGSWDQTIHLWDMTHPTLEGRLLRGHEFQIMAVAFSPDSHWLVSASKDQIVRLWDLVQPLTEPNILTVHNGEVTTVAFSPDQRWLASAGTDNTIRLWEGITPTATQALTGHQSPVNTIAFSPDGRWLASGSGDLRDGSDNHIRLWKMNNQTAPPIVLAGHTGPVNSLAFSPDGRWLASGSGDKSIRLWAVTDPITATHILTANTGAVMAVAFSPDGQWLASGARDRTIRLWRLADLSQTYVITGDDFAVRTVAFSPDSRMLASGGLDWRVKLWQVPTLASIQVLVGHVATIFSLAFSPDGRWLASTGFERTIRLWDMQNLQIEPRILYGHWDTVNSVAFRGDSQQLASGSADTTIRLWTVPIAGLIEKACLVAGRNLTAEEWLRYFPDQPYRRTCPQWSAGSKAIAKK